MRTNTGLLSNALLILGLILMVTPLALWVAWSQTVLLVVLGAGIGAAVLYCVLIRFEPEENPSSKRGLPQVRLSTKARRELESPLRGWLTALKRLLAG